MPLRWSLADPVASVAINMALQKELFASSPLPRCRVQDVYMEPRWPPYQPAGAHDMRDAKTRRRKQQCGKQKAERAEWRARAFGFLLSAFPISAFILFFPPSRLRCYPPPFGPRPSPPCASSPPECRHCLRKTSCQRRGSAIYSPREHNQGQQLPARPALTSDLRKAASSRANDKRVPKLRRSCRCVNSED